MDLVQQTGEIIFNAVWCSKLVCKAHWSTDNFNPLFKSRGLLYYILFDENINTTKKNFASGEVASLPIVQRIGSGSKIVYGVLICFVRPVGPKSTVVQSTLV